MILSACLKQSSDSRRQGFEYNYQHEAKSEVGELTSALFSDPLLLLSPFSVYIAHQNRSYTAYNPALKLLLISRKHAQSHFKTQIDVLARSTDRNIHAVCDWINFPPTLPLCC